jgi:hypothetical protein
VAVPAAARAPSLLHGESCLSPVSCCLLWYFPNCSVIALLAEAAAAADMCCTAWQLQHNGCQLFVATCATNDILMTSTATLLPSQAPEERADGGKEAKEDFDTGWDCMLSLL